jgi:hypothetical protein
VGVDAVDDATAHAGDPTVRLPKVSRNLRVSTGEMRCGRALLAGLGWAGTLGGVALCVLLFLSAYLAFDDDRPGVGPREDEVVRLPAVPDAEVPRVPLGRPPARLADDEDGGGAGGAGPGGAAARGGAPRSGVVPRAGTPGGAPPATPRSGTPPQVNAAPPPASAQPGPDAPSGGGSGGAGTSPPARPPQTIGDTTTDVVQVVGNEVKQVSPPVGEAINDTGVAVGDTVDALLPPPR